jgi:hypothetical protein
VTTQIIKRTKPNPFAEQVWNPDAVLDRQLRTGAAYRAVIHVKKRSLRTASKRSRLTWKRLTH